MPTVDPNGGATSVFPAERDPALFLTAYRGNLGVDAGLPGSVYTLDRKQLATGELKQVSGVRPQRLTPGQSWTLDDGTKLEFVGTRQFATLAVRYDPTQPLVLGGAVLGLLGLMLSLSGHRRRVWFRVSPPAGPDARPGGSLVEAGGLPRTDYPGFQEEFEQVVAAARSTGSPDERTP